MARSTEKKQCNGALLGFEASLFQKADKLHKNMDAAEHNGTPMRDGCPG